MSTVYVGHDTYNNSDREDGLYESDIQCAECGTNIGEWHEQRSDFHHFVKFKPYWMLDEDNNRNVCDSCYVSLFKQELREALRDQEDDNK